MIKSLLSRDYSDPAAIRNRDMKKHDRIKIVVTPAVALLIFFGCLKPTEGLRQQSVAPVVRTILAKHVTQDDFNDEISRRTLHNLVKYLDPYKIYFYKTDVDSFEKFAEKLDDYTKKNDFTAVAHVFDVYKKRYSEGNDLFKSLVKENYDFTVEETILIDTKKIEFAKDSADMRERWRKRIKLQLLNLLNSDMQMDLAKEKLVKRYELGNAEIEKIDSNKMMTIFLNSFATALDPHSNYMDAEEFEDFQISLSLKLTGIGAVLRSEDGFVYVDSIIPGGPVSKMSEDTAVRPNDKIIAVAQDKASPEPVTDIPLREAVEKIRGKKGTVVRLTIMRKDIDSGDETRLVIPVVRDEVILQDQAAKHAVHELKRGDTTVRIGYINLPSFYVDMNALFKRDPDARQASRDIFNALKDLNNKKIDTLVFDLRGNPGGGLDQAREIAGYFIHSGPVLKVKSSDGVMVHDDPDPAIYYNGPLVVLVDSTSASASEIFAGAIRDYKRGILVGPTRTFGKGTVQDLQPLATHGGAIKVTVQLFYQPSGTSNNNNGISPNIVVPDLLQAFDYYESSLDYPLEWQPLNAEKFEAYEGLVSDTIVGKLSGKSQKRVDSDPAFTEMKKKIERFRAQNDKNELSLKQEKSEEKESPLKTNRQDEKKVYDLENDIFLKESFEIAADYAEMLTEK